MLPEPTVPASLAALLEVLRPCLTAPSYQTFAQLVMGLIAGGGRRTVTGMLTGAGLARIWHHSRAHYLFAYARWSPDQLGLALVKVIVARLVPAGAPITLVVDDTLFRRRGRRVHAALWTHDGSAPGRSPVGFGNRWVICAVVVTLPFLTRPVALPVLFRLWVGKGTTTPVQLAVQCVALIAAAFPDRRIDVTGDAAYHSRALRALPERVSWTLRLRKKATLDELAPPPTGRRGRPRLRGQRLGTAAQLAATATFAPLQVVRYGRRRQVYVAVVTCLWYEPFYTRNCQVVLVREAGTTTGYDLALITTDLASPPAVIVQRYAARWSIEVAIAEAKQVIGAGQARNRLTKAVQRTVPFAMLVQTLVVLWYAEYGDPAGDVAAAHAGAPWYTTKAEPSFADMHASLAKMITAARFSPVTPGQPTDAEIRAVHAAWAAAEPAAAA